MEIKQHLKLSQQLVMTPQLQQAIKLLQLSRMELVDVVREELLENPVLEDSVEIAAEQQKSSSATSEAPSASAAPEAEAERIGETEILVARASEDKIDTTTEVKPDSRSGDAVADFDWDTYLESQSNAPPMPTYRPNTEDLPSLEATLTRGTSLFDHLEWQLKLSRNFSEAEERVALLIIGNLTPDGYLDASLDEIAEEAGVGVEQAEEVLRRVQEFDPPGVAARTLQECLLIQARLIGADDDIVVGMITRHLGNLEKKNYAPIAKDLNQPLDEIYEAAKVVMGLDPKPGSAYTNEEATTLRPTSTSRKSGKSTLWWPTTTVCPSSRFRTFTGRRLAKAPRRASTSRNACAAPSG